MEKLFKWDEKKNQKLLKERNISFEKIVSYIETENIVAIANGKGKYSHQKQFIVTVNQYIYIVPFVRENEYFFLKTIIPSRKLTKQYLLKEMSDENS